MKPTAMKVLKELRKGRRDIVDLNAMRDARKLAGELADAEGLPIEHARWMRAYTPIATLAHAILDTNAMRKLALRVSDAEDEYMPGAPPTSPVLDSVFMNWWMADLPVGPLRETVLSVIADIAPMLGLPGELRDCARTLSQSRMGVYRVEEVGPGRVRLEDLFTAEVVHAQLPDDLQNDDELWLCRLLPPIGSKDGDFVVWTTPYGLIDADAEQDWRAYGDRVAAGAMLPERAERLARHFKAQDDPRRWLEYIINGYAGESEVGAICLVGIPDQPETLPHHPAYEEPAAQLPSDATPLMKVRHRLVHIARSHPFVEAEPEARIRDLLGAPDRPLTPELSELLGLAYEMYGKLDASADSAVDLLVERAKELPPDERAVLAEIAAGWFSVFEVARVRIDEGMQLRDRLRRRTIWVDERSATRQVDLGDLLCGWVLHDGARYTLEGAICHVPARHAGSFSGVMQTIRDDVARLRPQLGWKKRAGLLAPYVVPLLDAVYTRAPLPELHNMDGHPLLFSTARYDVADGAAACRRLGALFESDGDGAYRQVQNDRLIADLELDDDTLTVRCNSKARLDAVKALLAGELGAALVHRVDSYEDPSIHMKPGARPSPADRKQAPELPEEARAQVQAMMLQHMRRWVDEPVPALGGKTPRQAVRSARGRDDVTLLLARQQETFAQPGLAPVDLREIWAELGLQPPG